MSQEHVSLASIFEGWDGYNLRLVHAIELRTRDDLVLRAAARMSSEGVIAGHISLGRIGWFNRMGAPGSFDLAFRTAEMNSEIEIADSPGELAWWLQASWKMIETTLSQWSVADLAQTYRLNYQGE